MLRVIWLSYGGSDDYFFINCLLILLLGFFKGKRFMLSTYNNTESEQKNIQD